MPRPSPLLWLLLCLLWPALALPVQGQDYTFTAPKLILNDIPFEATVKSTDLLLDAAGAADYQVQLDGTSYPLTFRADDDGGRMLVAQGLLVSTSQPIVLTLQRGGTTIATAETRSVPGWLSILPPLLAIAMALLFRRVIPALFLGIWVGAWTIAGVKWGWWYGLLAAFQEYVLGAMYDSSRLSIILFSFMIGGMVGIISRNGGMQGIVNRIVTWADRPERGQLATAMLGLVIFIDDYANTLVVGNTMRPVTDRLRISREKLAYIVDSTAAPVSCIFFVTTWIGYEVGLIGTAIEQIPGLQGVSAYGIFLSSIPYSFYPLLAIFFVFLVASTGRDYGAMYHAELRARTTGQVLRPGASIDEAAAEGAEVQPKEGQPQRIINAVLPIVVLIGGVVAGLLVTGEGETLRDVIGSADSYVALMWGSLVGVLVAGLLSITQKILTLAETIEAWYAGLKSMLFAMIILVLAWSLSDLTTVLHTADYLVAILGDALTPGLVPMLVFILAAATAFATGSSWGTMGILLPLVVPLTWAVMQTNGLANPDNYFILYSTISCVLAGSVWGDHCSPISDTTILSSMASGSDHIDHVRTQLPYALTVGSVAILLGTLPTGFGFPWWLSLPLGAAVLYTVLRVYGKTTNTAAA